MKLILTIRKLYLLLFLLVPPPQLMLGSAKKHHQMKFRNHIFLLEIMLLVEKYGQRLYLLLHILLSLCSSLNGKFSFSLILA